MSFLGVYAKDVEPIPLHNRNNQEVHLDYLKHLKKSVETLREIVKEAKVERPLDRSLAFACLYTKHSQELLEYAIGTCPKYFTKRDEKHATTPFTKKKLLKTYDGERSRSRRFMKKFIGKLGFRNRPLSDRASGKQYRPNIVEPELRTIVAPMAERTMEELLRAPKEGYGEAIVLPKINADHFEIKTNLLQLVQANPFYGQDIQYAGSDTRPPMLNRTDFESWQQRIRLYCLGKDNGENIMKSITEGPFQMGMFRETIAEGAEGALHLGPERVRVFTDLTAEEKERYKADIRATNILLQGDFEDYTSCEPGAYRRELLENLDTLEVVIHRVVNTYGILRMKENDVNALKENRSQLHDEILHGHQITKSVKMQSFDIQINPVQAMDDSLIVSKSSLMESENNNALSKSEIETQMQMQEEKVDMHEESDVGL
ncbi:hypothetical protein Tco_0045540, partial [Tanacetum coccineum]